MDYMDEEQSGESAWRANYSTLAALADKVTEVLDDQAERGQVLKLSEAEARSLYPNLVVASPSANRKDKPNGVVIARVLFDGTNGIHVNKRTRIRDQERSPIAAVLKRAMREKARVGERTFALTADVSEAHRQVPIAECDWRMQARSNPGLQSTSTRLGPLAVPLLLTTGLELRRPWAAWLSTSLENRRTHGTCWWRTTSTLKPVALGTVQHCSPCSSCVRPAMFLSRGIRLRAEIQQLGLASNSSIEARNFSETRRMVHSMFERCCVVGVCEDVNVRGRIGTHCICRRSSGERAPFPSSSVSFPHVASQTVSQKSSSVRRIHPDTSFQAVGTLPTLSLCSQPAFFRRLTED